MFKKIAFVGAGSMAEALIAGIVKSGVLEPNQIYVTNRSNQTRLQELTQLYAIQSTSDTETAISGAEAIFLAMKPKDVVGALAEIKPFVSKDKVIISILAGTETKFIADQLGMDLSVIRAMPNTSATIGYGATGLTKGAFVTEEQIQLARTLFETVGTVTIVDEEQMHTVTAVAGSGPAYFYYIVEAMEEAAKKGGLNQVDAKELIYQTILGAAEMLKQTDDEPALLRKKITSPGGTTERGIKTLEEHSVKEAIEAAVYQASNRSKELGEN
ncbi:pyrroline-5-carboxylate reductase [Paraliobacillus quinghaiensis]|uniref:Pyrroline-5-carboxylate reductase n=1 Tax=Paraliobacillus quinghaiensis TaxID=470815 RepID=A0A917TXG6_9BACI|nr:pyrroline-5-carboxylate reductase [Paraliobacillus quinghaiensis]GGM43220.1 pyrroline-5-carboxylate reductase [Paraliobacillus quinghaiensis]